MTMGKDRKQKNPPPDHSIYEDRGPEQEPNTYPGSGQHQPDIQDEKSKKKRSNIPTQKKGDINPEEAPGGNPEIYNDSEPVEEKSPRARL